MSERANVLFAAELCLVYALVLGAWYAWRGYPFTGVWIAGALLLTVGAEVALKYGIDQPGPSAFLATIPRPACGSPGPAYPLTVVSTPGSLPSGYATRMAYFGVLVAVSIGARWPRLRAPARVVLAIVVAALGASRVVVGWHWPSDVLAGVLLGWAAALLVAGQADGLTWTRPPEDVTLSEGRGADARRSATPPARR
ncbi:MAG: phosphatase PAP2 family protein [Chloroflexi bacterium]|nr:phosphatase PAP2 family protein [Chloroflexota bacterium]